MCKQMGRMSDEARRCRNEKNKERMHKSFPKWENNLKIGRGCAMGKPEPGGDLPGSGASGHIEGFIPFGEGAEACGRDVVELRVGVGHEFVAFFRCGVE